MLLWGENLLGGFALGSYFARGNMLWGGKCCSGKLLEGANVALGRKLARGICSGDLLWGVNPLWRANLEEANLLWGENLLWGVSVALGE